MHRSISCPRLFGLLVAVISVSGGAHGSVLYSIDDGTSERAIGIDPGEDQIWLNTFAVAPGGEIIDSISAAYGRPGGPSVLNGLAVSILLYEDLDGGSPLNAVLKQSVNAVLANGNTNTLNIYPITPTEIHGTLVAAVLFRNTTAVNKFIAASDESLPTLAGRSYAGFDVNGLNEADLSTIPAGQFKTIEEFGFPGNWLIRASGQPVPEPSSFVYLVSLAVMMKRGRR